MGRYLPRVCRQCGETFQGKVSEINCGKALFCGRACMALGKRGPKTTPTLSFWARAQSGPPDSCWPWLGARTSAGYGHFYVGGAHYYAHRFSYEIHVGPISDDLYVCHHCDNPPCVNPAHLFLGTHVDNMHDMNRKGRGRRPILRGADSHRAKLTTGDVVRIRELLASGESGVAIAASFGVSASAISSIRRGQTWLSN